MIVPLIDLQAQFRPIRAEVLEAIARVCDSQRFILGPEVESFERDMASMLGVSHAIGVSSGTDALLVALMALGVGPGGEVIVPALSFFATAGCPSRLGARPVFVDVDPGTLTIDPRAVDAAVTSRTRAIIPVHLYGLPADLDPLVEIARRRGVALLEDAAQAIGARYHDRLVGGDGMLAAFSFFPTKNLGAFGDAGLLTTSDEGLAARVRRLRDHGADRRYFHHEVGGNFRIDALQAAVLRVKAPHLAEWTRKRRANAARYRELFAEHRLSGVTLPSEPPGLLHIYHQFVIRSERRDALRQHLTSAGVGTEIYYPVPLHLQECFADLGGREGMLPIAERAAREVLALPIYGELTDEQLRYVVERIADFEREER